MDIRELGERQKKSLNVAKKQDISVKLTDFWERPISQQLTQLRKLFCTQCSSQFNQAKKEDQQFNPMAGWHNVLKMK